MPRRNRREARARRRSVSPSLPGSEARWRESEARARPGDASRPGAGLAPPGADGGADLSAAVSSAHRRALRGAACNARRGALRRRAGLGSSAQAPRLRVALRERARRTPPAGGPLGSGSAPPLSGGADSEAAYPTRSSGGGGLPAALHDRATGILSFLFKNDDIRYQEQRGRGSPGRSARPGDRAPILSIQE